ncbi:MAG TPA: ATP-binding protein [Anaerolineales bacterium]
MSAWFGQLGALLTASPGNLIYQLVLAFSIAGALQAAYVRWQSGHGNRDRRALVGLAAMLAGLAAYFLLGIALAAGGALAHIALPPLDRALTLILLTWAIWLWAFPEPARQPDVAVWIISALAIGAGVLSAIVRGFSPAATFNQTIWETLWQLATLGLLAVGAALLYIRRTEGYINGFAFVALAFLGSIASLFFRQTGDYPGLARLAHIAAFPLLLTLSQRFAAPAVERPATLPAEGLQAGESKPRGADPKTVHAFLSLASETDPTRTVQGMARTVSHTLLADLCFILLPTEYRSRLQFASGYDLIREDYLEGATVDIGVVPRIASAMQHGNALRLQADPEAEDIRGLSDLLGLKSPGNILSAPIVTANNEPLGAILLLSPYSQREWSTEDQDLLVSIGVEMAPLLQRSKDTAEGVVPEDLNDVLRLKEEQIQRLQQRGDDLTQQLEMLALEAAPPADTTELDLLRAANQQAEARIRELELQLESSKVPASAPELEAQLKETLRDLASLQNQLADSQQRMLEHESAPGGKRVKKEQAEVVVSISQELRQPMSSIIGYTDLLLGESVGILGALQRKFIERIKASTERIGGLINDLIQLTTLEVGLSDLKPEAMDLNVIIDNALAYTSSQIREKKISIHLDLPKNVAPVSADREALQQILIHLLQNAGAATPMEGSVSLKVFTTMDQGRQHVMIQVTDSGGGIPEEDLPRVFTRLFRADNVLIQGVGDTGVGLSIAKTLTEAQHGRIWVESQPGSGATFCVLLPAVADTVGRIPGKEPR